MNTDLQSVAVFEVERDGKLIRATSGPGPDGEHAIKYVWRLLQEEGVKPEQVKRIYSEVEPCRPPIGNCADFIIRTFPQAEITYSFEQGNTVQERFASLKRFKKTLKQLRQQK